MGYRHIENLYKDTKILLFRECYALEKVHGTSAHVKMQRVKTEPVDGVAVPDDVRFHFFSGGASELMFIQLFDREDLKKRFLETGLEEICIYGEAYGGKLQGMRDTYGDKLCFIGFEVETAGKFLGVESACMFTEKMGLEFVPFRKISTDLASLDAERDLPSRVAVRRGITEPRISEGVVLRPPVEVGFNGGDKANFGRIIVKHKRPEFSERTSKRDTVVDPGRLEVLTNAEVIAAEWVTPVRLEHVLDKLVGSLHRDLNIRDTPKVIAAMVEDVTREARDEIVASKEATKAICSTAARLFKTKLDAGQTFTPPKGTA